MKKSAAHAIYVPADVPQGMIEDYRDNLARITHDTGRLMLFAADQKIEHLNQDFYGDNIHPEAQNPEHIFNIAHKGRIGALATHLGLIARYGHQYRDIPYIVKLNGKTNIVPHDIDDPISRQLWTIDDVIDMKFDTELPLCGVGYTLYIGSAYESIMLHEAAQIIYQAHQHGLVTVVWIYARGKSVTDDTNIDVLAGAAGIANALGADFVKIKPPHASSSASSAELLRIATAAAGNTKVICSGGSAQSPDHFLRELYDQLHTGYAGGSATGRNIFQRSNQHAIAMTNAISAIVYDNKTVDEALKIYHDMSA